MKKLLTSFLTLALILTLAVPALAEGSAPRLTVTGSATVSIDADYATIELGTVTRGESAQAAQSENDKIMTEVIAALKELGIKEEDIRTSNFSVHMEQADYGPYSEARALPPYVVNNMLSVTIKDIALVSKVIDAAASKGANNVYSLVFQASKNAEATKQAITLAVKDARDRAQIMAEAAGKTLGELVDMSIPANYGSLYAAKENFAMAVGGDMGTPIISGKVSVYAEVTMVFELK